MRYNQKTGGEHPVIPAVHSVGLEGWGGRGRSSRGSDGGRNERDKGSEGGRHESRRGRRVEEYRAAEGGSA